MAVRIRSLVTSGPVLVPLSTGASVRLSPGQISDEMPDVEVANNAKVDKLRRQRLMDIAPGVEPAAEPAAESNGESVAEPDAQGDSKGESRPRSRKRTESSG